LPASPARAGAGRGGVVRNDDVQNDSRKTTPDFTIQVVKCPGDLLGAGLGNTSKGAVIFNVKPGGVLAQYNKDASEEHKLGPGFIIEEVNGVTGYWNILEELRKLGVLKMKISATPPPRASPNWFEEIATMGKELEAQGSPFMVRLQPQDPGSQSQPTFSSLPHVRAGDIGVEQCAICLEDVDPQRGLVQLPCGHAFHALCAARWLTQNTAGGKHQGCGTRQCCPLCNRTVVGTKDGKIEAVDAAP
jgi:hypothetical protein